MSVNRRFSKGFTLVELIVVIAIIAVLAAIAVPLVSGYVAGAQASSCAEQRQAVATQYQSDYAMARSGDPSVSDNAVADSALAKLGATGSAGSYNGLCPSGGTYTVTVNGGQVTVACSIAGHGGAGTPAPAAHPIQNIASETNPAIIARLREENLKSIMAIANKMLADIFANAPAGAKYLSNSNLIIYNTGTKMSLSFIDENGNRVGAGAVAVDLRNDLLKQLSDAGISLSGGTQKITLALKRVDYGKYEPTASSIQVEKVSGLTGTDGKVTYP